MLSQFKRISIIPICLFATQRKLIWQTVAESLYAQLSCELKYFLVTCVSFNFLLSCSYNGLRELLFVALLKSKVTECMSKMSSTFKGYL